MNEEVHGVNIDKGVILDKSVLNFDCHLFTSLQTSLVYLSQTGCAERILIEILEKLLCL